MSGALAAAVIAAGLAALSLRVHLALWADRLALTGAEALGGGLLGGALLGLAGSLAAAAARAL